MPVAPFTWRDGERVIAFGRGVHARAVELLGGEGYTLLTTPRAAAVAPAVVDAGATVHTVGSGRVEDLAGDLLGTVRGERIVALGGGRVIDVAKALAAAAAGDVRAMAVPATLSGAEMTRGHRHGGGVRAMAVPTTLSGAEMTRGHRHARGVDESTPRVRPAVVVYDPALAASQPERALVASALNALGHAVEAPCTRRANPVSTLAAHEAAGLLVRSLARSGEPDRDRLALGALLAGYAIDSAGLGLHHVLAQTLVRVAGIGHGEANAAMLPHTIAALAWRCPDAHDALAGVLGDEPVSVASRLAERARADHLTDLGVDPAVLPAAAEAAAARDQLELTPPRAGVGEILALYQQAL